VEEVKFGREAGIIVCKDINAIYYRVRYSIEQENCFLALEWNPDYVKGVIFNEFPLLVKGNRLIPIDKEKQLECWFDNGFFFPKMKLSKKNKKYDVMNGHDVGLKNLPAEMKKGISKPLPRKYIRLNDLENRKGIK